MLFPIDPPKHYTRKMEGRLDGGQAQQENSNSLDSKVQYDHTPPPESDSDSEAEQDYALPHRPHMQAGITPTVYPLAYQGKYGNTQVPAIPTYLQRTLAEVTENLTPGETQGDPWLQGHHTQFNNNITHKTRWTDNVEQGTYVYICMYPAGEILIPVDITKGTARLRKGLIECTAGRMQPPATPASKTSSAQNVPTSVGRPGQHAHKLAFGRNKKRLRLTTLSRDFWSISESILNIIQSELGNTQDIQEIIPGGKIIRRENQCLKAHA
ncbi:hypothetical protein M422DRAFT_273882 [Sphaerobolus stellatus SS14]|uniref:Uncharacterized protein n=1 Tax=Sphaerobolus stellatus (strain SS14) TaxID=990650 RepID=A0A0C9UIT9_SPHS4|nr:hypothetical protein M422DRAFT_273882 [Sphaerobolus stellatus SS14]